MAEAEKTAEAQATEEAAQKKPKRSRIKLFAIGGAVLTLCLGGGGYFAVPMALAMFAPAQGAAAAHEAAAGTPSAHGEASETAEAAGGGGHGGGGAGAVPAQIALPVKTLALPQAAASDYQIVSIYDGEAFLATNETVIRVKVGSTAPGLGDILSIEPSGSGGVVTGTLATLKTS